MIQSDNGEQDSGSQARVEDVSLEKNIKQKMEVYSSGESCSTLEFETKMDISQNDQDDTSERK